MHAQPNPSLGKVMIWTQEGGNYFQFNHVLVLIAALAAEVVASDNLPLTHVGTSVVQGSLDRRLLRNALSAAGPKRRLHDVSMRLLFVLRPA